RQSGQRPRRPDAAPARGRDDAVARGLVLSGAPRRARDRRGGRRGRRCPGGARRPARGHANADDRRGRARPPRRGGAGRRRGSAVKIAVVGGTGTFGRALAARLHELGHEVAIGSRDPERAKEQAAAIGVEGGANAEVVAEAEYVVLATASGAAIDTARELK